VSKSVPLLANNEFINKTYSSVIKVTIKYFYSLINKIIINHHYHHQASLPTSSSFVIIAITIDNIIIGHHHRLSLALSVIIITIIIITIITTTTKQPPPTPPPSLSLFDKISFHTSSYTHRRVRAVLFIFRRLRSLWRPSSTTTWSLSIPSWTARSVSRTALALYRILA